MAYSAMRKALRIVNAASLATSASVTNGSAYDIPDATDLGELVVNVSAIAGGSATVTVKLQHSPDGGVTWVDTGLTTAALSATGAVRVAIDRNLFPKIRAVATLSPTTTPTATYSMWLGYSSAAGAVPRAAA